MLFLAIGLILLFVFQYNQVIDTKKFIQDSEPYLRFLMEDDYKFLLNVKYNGKLYLVEHIIKYLLDIYATWGIFVDIVTNVPMFPTKEKERGYNQSKIIAQEFAKSANISFFETCEKVIDTVSQTTLNTNERLKNVENCYKVKSEIKRKLKNKTVLIIDDVITTGATTNELSRIMLKAGAKTCYVLTFAHTPFKQLNIENSN